MQWTDSDSIDIEIVRVRRPVGGGGGCVGPGRSCERRCRGGMRAEGQFLCSLLPRGSWGAVDCIAAQGDARALGLHGCVFYAVFPFVTRRA